MFQSPKRLILLALATTIAATTLTLSYPRLTSSLTYLPVDAALKRHWVDYPIKEEQFPTLIETAQHSIDKLNEARYWLGLGWLNYLHATTQSIITKEGKQSLNDAQSAFETFLKKSPSSPSAWLRLAWTHAQLGHEAKKIVETLKMSFYTGRAERYLMINRLELALRYANHFDPEDKSLLQDQIQLTWRFYKRDMQKFIKTGAFSRNTINTLLDNNPELKQEINKKLNVSSDIPFCRRELRPCRRRALAAINTQHTQTAPTPPLT